MADEPVEVHEDEERAPALDPETRARRDAALRLVRKYGDPVLRSRALEVDRFHERLAASPHRPALVVTRPDRPKGRGRRLSPPPVAEAARRLGLDLLQPEAL